MLMAKIEKKGFIFICFLFGVMIAIQINSLKQETEIESRSTWQLRENLTNAMKTETKLLQEIQEIDELIAQYETEKVQSGKTILTDTLKELRLEAGLEEWEGPGITITVTRAEEFIEAGDSDPYISPSVLHKLINELNRYGAQAISIGEQRITPYSTIRFIEGETKIDGYPLRDFPLHIKVITEDEETAEKLYNYMQVSTIADDFFIERFRISISEPKQNIVIPAYNGDFKIKTMEIVN
jgi:uncharacterized protein YlxW (UPF0749 family)